MPAPRCPTGRARARRPGPGDGAARAPGRPHRRAPRARRARAETGRGRRRSRRSTQCPRWPRSARRDRRRRSRDASHARRSRRGRGPVRASRPWIRCPPRSRAMWAGCGRGPRAGPRPHPDRGAPRRRSPRSSPLPIALLEKSSRLSPYEDKRHVRDFGSLRNADVEGGSRAPRCGRQEAGCVRERHVPPMLNRLCRTQGHRHTGHGDPTCECCPSPSSAVVSRSPRCPRSRAAVVQATTLAAHVSTPAVAVATGISPATRCCSAAGPSAGRRPPPAPPRQARSSTTPRAALLSRTPSCPPRSRPRPSSPVRPATARSRP